LHGGEAVKRREIAVRLVMIALVAGMAGWVAFQGRANMAAMWAGFAGVLMGRAYYEIPWFTKR
jgi:hypothetical protein